MVRVQMTRAAGYFEGCARSDPMSREAGDVGEIQIAELLVVRDVEKGSPGLETFSDGRFSRNPRFTTSGFRSFPFRTSRLSNSLNSRIVSGLLTHLLTSALTKAASFFEIPISFTTSSGVGIGVVITTGPRFICEPAVILPRRAMQVESWTLFLCGSALRSDLVARILGAVTAQAFPASQSPFVRRTLPGLGPNQAPLGAVAAPSGALQPEAGYTSPPIVDAHSRTGSANSRQPRTCQNRKGKLNSATALDAERNALSPQ